MKTSIAVLVAVSAGLIAGPALADGPLAVPVNIPAPRLPEVQPLSQDEIGELASASAETPELQETVAGELASDVLTWIYIGSGLLVLLLFLPLMTL